ncbi:MAG: histidinol dehydrogenase, partial [Acholeplasmatales bacterium]|nr:histidinol dehydrogenase [Acholeplasmatales bacterium]
MIEIIKDKKDIDLYFEMLNKRGAMNGGAYLPTVQKIIADVIKDGDNALEAYTKKFDDPNFDIKNIEISKEEQKKAFDSLDKKMQEVLLKAKDRVYDYHTHQLRKTFLYEGSLGEKLGQRISPINKVGVYVPGGKAAYPSSVIMNVIPAKVAGCKNIIMVTPAPKGELNKAVIAAAYVCGVDHVYKVGGAQAIAALAYGTKSIEAVDKITGPGNIFVALAKKEVYGKVGIDSVAGPSEVLVIADETSNPKFIAADLMAQAEHDEIASSTLLTVSEEVAKKTVEYINEFLKLSTRKEILEKSLTNCSKIIIVKDLDEACEISNKIAPEHLEISIDNANRLVDKLTNAGAIFIGHYSVEALGDYMAGPNHTLPTCGTARFFSPLGVDDFIKKTSL